MKNPSSEGIRDGYEQFKNKFFPTLLLDYSVWPIANFINFWYVPTFYQPVYVSCVTFFFNIVFSFIANREISK